MHLPKVVPFAHDPIYFFTACTAGRRPLLACNEAHNIIVRIWRNSLFQNGWSVGRYVLMPDHVHFFARPPRDGTPLAKWHQTWKSLTARKLMTALGIRAPVWQPETFDHILRSAESYAAKWHYVRQNPVRAELSPSPEAWPWQGEIVPLRF